METTASLHTYSSFPGSAWESLELQALPADRVHHGRMRGAKRLATSVNPLPRRVSFEVALFRFKAEGLTQPLPVSKAPEHENSWVLGPKGRYTT